MVKRRKTTTYKVVAAYDTETTNLPDHTAFVSLYILNDLRDVGSLRDYTVDCESEHITFDRDLDAFIPRLEDLMRSGSENGYVPVVAAYNLMFDMQTLMGVLSQMYDIRVTAQSSTHVYTLDLYASEDADAPLLRFWDTFFLEMNGLKAMGETAGVPKAVGDWDYTLVRTPGTPLTDRELYYAGRDVQVIPAYLSYLLHANDWLSEDMFGCRVLTKTSLVRQMASFDIGSLPQEANPDRTLEDEMKYLCMREFPADYDTYALRKACFRGGFTFTSATFASTVQHNVASLDVTSMHHTFINGRRVPVRFRKRSRDALQAMADAVLDVSVDEALRLYYKPFLAYFHACVRFSNIRVREGTPFAAWGIGLTPRGKFGRKVEPTDFYDRPDEIAAETGIRERGWMDTAVNPVFAYGKLMRADEATLFVSETELWTMRRVYAWDDMTVLFGEGTSQTVNPPAYVTLQSNLLFNRKSDVKRMTKVYHEGEPFDGDIPKSIPDGLADLMRSGSMTDDFLTAYYNGTVKGQFNSIYGTMAQDVMRPDYMVDGEGLIRIDRGSVASPENFKRLKPRSCKVLYTYGMRIVAGSRMHLVIAILKLWEALGDRVHVTGGDTDSLKVACDSTVTDDELAAAVEPLLTASTKAIARCQVQLREAYPDMVSPLTHVGGFEVENAGAHYESHMEYWNKARVSMDASGHCHITMAGLSRPHGMYHIENWLDDMIAAGHPVGRVFGMLGYDTVVEPGLAHSMQRTNPRPFDLFDADVTDYRGVTTHVTAPMAICLYKAPRVLGDLSKPVNLENVRWLHAHGNMVDTPRHTLGVDDTTAYAADMMSTLMEAIRHG